MCGETSIAADPGALDSIYDTKSHSSDVTSCATTLLQCRAYSMNHQELVFHQDHVPLQGLVPGIHPEDVDDL